MKDVASPESDSPVEVASHTSLPDWPQSPNRASLNLWFDHGLGDCANFAHILEVYRQRGYAIDLRCPDDKSFVFRTICEETSHDHALVLGHVHYPESSDVTTENAHEPWRYNKVGINLVEAPLPSDLPREELWRELLSVRLDLTQRVSAEDRKAVSEFLAPLPRPIVLIHSMGNTLMEMKNMPENDAVELYRRLLDRIEGSLVLLDWDDRVPRLANGRVRHMTDDWERIGIERLVALMDQSDLLISVDSGPLHLARMNNLPVVGMFPTFMTYPSRMTLPRSRTLSVVPANGTRDLNSKIRLAFNIVESPGPTPFDPVFIAEVSARMLEEPRYLTRDRIAADVQLQQFVREWERGEAGYLSAYVDRHLGYDAMLREIRRRFTKPQMVETGCIRSSEDWRGTGYSTYLLATLAHRTEGHLVSVDNDPAHCAFARGATHEMKESVTIVESDSVAYLREYQKPIDVLHLDSMDTAMPGCMENVLQEIQAAYPRLHEHSIVCFDDTVYERGGFTGNGKLAAPWLLERGWRILHSGYQTICVRENGSCGN